MATPVLEVRQHNYALGYPSYTNAAVLGANTAESLTIPADCNVVNFSGNLDFYVNYTTTATVPSGDITDGSASELNPTIRRVAKGATISVIAPAATVVTYSCFRL